jgi:hypothetical protein
MPERALDIRLAILKNSKDDQDVVDIFNKIKEMLGISKDTEVLKSCIRKAMEYYFEPVFENKK